MDKEMMPTPPATTAPSTGGSCAAGDNMAPGTPLAMVYAPCQMWRDLYEPALALERGTLFKELDLPFLGSQRGDTE